MIRNDVTDVPKDERDRAAQTELAHEPQYFAQTLVPDESQCP
jgi:hypothetical protein